MVLITVAAAQAIQYLTNQTSLRRRGEKFRRESSNKIKLNATSFYANMYFIRRNSQ
jgi:hypothetical protein